MIFPQAESRQPKSGSQGWVQTRQSSRHAPSCRPPKSASIQACRMLRRTKEPQEHLARRNPRWGHRAADIIRPSPAAGPRTPRHLRRSWRKRKYQSRLPLSDASWPDLQCGYTACWSPVPVLCRGTENRSCGNSCQSVPEHTTPPLARFKPPACQPRRGATTGLRRISEKRAPRAGFHGSDSESVGSFG